MKHLLFLSAISLVLFSGAASPQTSDSFDIATFTIPKGWTKEASERFFQITTQDKVAGTYCVITVYRSVPGTNDSKESFDLAWKSIVKETVNPAVAPVMQRSKNDEGGWQAEMGSAPFAKDGANGVAILVTVSGFSKMLSTLILTNSDVYEPAIRAFFESADLKKPDSNEAVKQSQTIVTGASSALSVTSSNWKQSQSRKDAMGSYGGYSANTYRFLADNTYRFSQVTFQNYAPKYYLEDEEGSYSIAGSTITLTPKKAAFRTYRSSQQDPILKSGSIPLESVQYSYEIINLNNNWTLLLSPVGGVETRRDGQFSFWLNGEKRKTYSYNSVNAAGELIRIER